MASIIKSRYQGYCGDCHYTIWEGEPVKWYSTKITHIDCKDAIADGTIRILKKSYQEKLGNVSLKKLKRMLEDNSLAGQSPAYPPKAGVVQG